MRNLQRQQFIIWETTDRSVSVLNRDLQILMTETDKVYNNKAAPNFIKIFSKWNGCILRFSDPHTRSIYNGTESLLFKETA